jgi:ATP-dependent exoDNAse (exonuclease V) alpha subunit
MPDNIPAFGDLTEKEWSYIDPNTIDEFSYIYKNMPIIANKTKKDDYFNNQQFTVKKFEDDIVSIKGDGDTMKIPLAEFQINFRPRYCMTVHKSQGATIRRKHAVHEFDRLSMYANFNSGDLERNLAYVALTRTSDVKYLTLVR